jgi:hypothetical protein
MVKNISYSVVFDLDETLGHFVQLGIFNDLLEKYYKKPLSSNNFFKLMDIFPEVLRPNILKILSNLKQKKIKGICNKVIIYTNNQGPKEWAIKIKDFLEKKIQYKLFDQIIGAYKVNNKLIEHMRTTHDKTSRDLFKIANLSENSKVCFLDDLYHPLMDNDNTYYINVSPYYYTYNFYDMAERYYKHNSNKIKNKSKFINFIVNESKAYRFKNKDKTISEINNDMEVSKEIHDHLKNFFKLNKKNKTKRIRRINKNITRKNTKNLSK